jgi:hypothetical protein
MTPIQVAVLLLRFFSVYLFIDVMVVLTELPPNIYGIFNAQSDYLVTQREIALGLELVRLFVYAGTGIAFLVFSRPLAKLFTKGLENIKHDDVV